MYGLSIEIYLNRGVKPFEPIKRQKIEKGAAILIPHYFCTQARAEQRILLKM